MTETALYDAVKIGIVSISDRASTGVYEDKGLPALQDWLERALRNPISFEARLIPDEQATISATLIELVDQVGCNLVLTTGGTGPARLRIVGRHRHFINAFGENLIVEHIENAVAAAASPAAWVHVTPVRRSTARTRAGRTESVSACDDLEN